MTDASPSLVDRLRDVDEPNALIVRRKAADEIERLRGVLERIIAEDSQADWYYADIAREALKDAK